MFFLLGGVILVSPMFLNPISQGLAFKDLDFESLSPLSNFLTPHPNTPP